MYLKESSNIVVYVSFPVLWVGRLRNIKTTQKLNLSFKSIVCVLETIISEFLR